jgi:PhnB protein
MAKQARPEGCPWMMPYLMVRDADQSLAFYEKAFGFEKRMAMPGEDGKTFHAEMAYNDMIIMFAPEGVQYSPAQSPATSGVPSPVSLMVYCEDVDAACKRAEAAGAKVKQPPTDMFWGDRICKLVDPDGHVWTFGTHIGESKCA